MNYHPRLVFVSELPPSHLNGGLILMHRLLSGYPADRLTVACSAGLLPRAAKSMLPCRHVGIYRTSGTGRWGIGRVRQLVNLIALWPNVLALERLLRETHAEVVLTVAHDTMFLAGVLAAKRVGIPSVVVVHDDWTWIAGQHPFIPRAATAPIFRSVLRHASHVYAISDGVQEWLKADFGVASELQLPCADASVFCSPAPRNDPTFHIAYTGVVVESVLSALTPLVHALRNGVIGDNWVLHLYGGSQKHMERAGWNDRRVVAHGWLSQDEVHAAMTGADLLYVPVGFDEESRRLAQRQFPSKLADYLAARRPVLVCASAEAAVSRYVRNCDCAELVEENSAAAVAEALQRLVGSPQRRKDLVERGWAAFQANHDVVLLRSQLVSRLRQLCGHEAIGNTEVRLCDHALSGWQ